MIVQCAILLGYVFGSLMTLITVVLLDRLIK